MSVQSVEAIVVQCADGAAEYVRVSTQDQYFSTENQGDGRDAGKQLMQDVRETTVDHCADGRFGEPVLDFGSLARIGPTPGAEPILTPPANTSNPAPLPYRLPVLS